MKRFLMVFMFLATVLVFGSTEDAQAAGVTYKTDDGKYVKLGGRIMMQYHQENEETGVSSDETTDSLFIRRFRPYIEGSIHQDWKGKFQWDMGKGSGDNELSVKEASITYLGWKKDYGLELKIGNATSPFSREVYTSSKYQQTVERQFTGDHNYGVPDKNFGLHLKGSALDKKLGFVIALTSATLDPDDDKIDFDTPVNMSSDWNEGNMISARADYNIIGNVKMSQGDFDGDLGVALGVGVLSWSNDDDNNTYTDSLTGEDLDTTNGKSDVDSVTGTELSLAVRGYGFSLDGQINTIEAELAGISATTGLDYTSGLYKNGETELENQAIEIGYMVIPSKLELVAAVSSQTADTYAADWERTDLGLNYYFEGHDIKLQFTYRENENVDGVKKNNLNETFVQMQYVF